MFDQQKFDRFSRAFIRNNMLMFIKVRLQPKTPKDERKPAQSIWLKNDQHHEMIPETEPETINLECGQFFNNLGAMRLRFYVK